ncbi:MAG TPA: hypothetical protein ENI42_06015, partial [Thermoplasmatales archaeon]|nr:hypothetical protein [Thermoplasmatales archaeon]
GIGADGNYYKNVTITLTAEDKGIGVNHTYYRLDGSVWLEYTEPFLVDERGEHTLEYYSVDYLGHEETVQTETFNVSNINFKINITSPENGLYVFGKKLLSMHKTIVVGNIDVEAELVPFDPSVPPEFDQVVFYVDNSSVATFTSQPFEWNWEGSAFGKHSLSVTAFNDGDSVTKSVEILIFKF